MAALRRLSLSCIASKKKTRKQKGRGRERQKERGRERQKVER
tara:strand:- start:66 stop:191 length:126 start_codon:yes stop_codon:yes gene_type:complete